MISKENILDALKKVADPHMGISIVDMGLIRNVEIDENNNVSFDLVPTNPGCMSVMSMAIDAKETVKKVDGVNNVKVIIKGHILEEDLNKIING
jgi:metal-sulfur cluster biosynthetic enzyme